MNISQKYYAMTGDSKANWCIDKDSFTLMDAKIACEKYAGYKLQWKNEDRTVGFKIWYGFPLEAVSLDLFQKCYFIFTVDNEKRITMFNKEELIQNAKRLVDDVNKKVSELGFVVQFLNAEEERIQVSLSKYGNGNWSHQVKFNTPKPMDKQDSIQAGVDIVTNVITINPLKIDFDYSLFLRYDELLYAFFKALVYKWEDYIRTCELEYVKTKLSPNALKMVDILHKQGLFDAYSMYSYTKPLDEIVLLFRHAIWKKNNTFILEANQDLSSLIELNMWQVCDLYDSLSFGEHLTFSSNENTHIMYAIIHNSQ